MNDADVDAIFMICVMCDENSRWWWYKHFHRSEDKWPNGMFPLDQRPSCFWIYLATAENQSEWFIGGLPVDVFLILGKSAPQGNNPLNRGEFQ